MSPRREVSIGKEPRVLVVRFSSLGDIVLTLPTVDSLKKALPETRIIYATKKMYAPLLTGQTSIDRILSLGDKGEGAGWWALYRLCRQAGSIDLVVDLHGNLRSLLCRLFTGAPAIRYDKDTLGRRLLARGIAGQGRKARHVADRYLDTLRQIGVSGEVREPRVELSARELESAAEFLQGRGVRDPSRIAVIAPGAKWPNKEWTPLGFARVATMLSEKRGLQPVIVGDSADRGIAGEIIGAAGRNAVDITGRTALRELTAVLALAQVFIGNDSGPGHLAAAAGTATVVLFGPTSEEFGFTPRGRRVKSVSLPLACRPCSIHGGTRCPEGGRTCLDGIEPETVFTAATDLLDERHRASLDAPGGGVS